MQSHSRNSSQGLAYVDYQQQQQQQNFSGDYFNFNRAPNGSTNTRSPNGALNVGNGGSIPMSALKDINMSQLSSLSVNQLAALQQQLSAISQISQQNGMPPSNHDGVASSINLSGVSRHSRQPSNSQLMQNLQSALQQPPPQSMYNAHSSNYQQQQQQQLFNPLPSMHSQIPPHQYQSHLLAPPQPQFGNFMPTASSSSAPPSQAKFSPASNPPTVTTSSSSHAPTSKPRRTSRSAAAARLSPTPFPTVDLKLKRKLRKNNREKQRRSEINDQFDILCQLLGLGASNDATSTTGSAATPKVEKFAILSEACHSITQLRLELSVYKAEKAENRVDFQKLTETLDNLFKSHTIQVSASDLLSGFFPSLQRPDYVLPPSKAAQPPSAGMDSDEDCGTIDEDGEGDKEMGQSQATSGTSTSTRQRRGSPNVGKATSSSTPSVGEKRRIGALSTAATTASPSATSSSSPASVVPPMPATSLSSPPSLPSPTNNNPFTYTATSDPSTSVAFGSVGRASPSLATLLASNNGAPSSMTTRASATRSSHVDPPSIPTHRPRQHSRSNSSSSSALPRFGSNDFGSPAPAVQQAMRASHSRQASHARSRSLQLNGALGLKDELLDDKPTLEGGIRGGHSRSGSNSIPPPPSIPGMNTRIGGGLGGLHSHTSSMDLGFGLPTGMMSPGLPNNLTQTFTFYQSSKPITGRVGGHVRHPSGSNSSAIAVTNFLHLESNPLSSNHPLHHRHRSTASIGGSDMFQNVNMDDVELNPFDTAYGH